MDITSGRKKMALAWASPKASATPMNVDLVQSVAHILVRECFQAKIDVLNEVLEMKEEGARRGEEIIHPMRVEKLVESFQEKLREHELENAKSERVFKFPHRVGKDA